MEEDNEELEQPIFRGELETVLHWFKKGKSPRPDGWTIEFYLSFYDLIGTDLLNIVEECAIPLGICMELTTLHS